MKKLKASLSQRQSSPRQNLSKSRSAEWRLTGGGLRPLADVAAPPIRSNTISNFATAASTTQKPGRPSGEAATDPPIRSKTVSNFASTPATESPVRPLGGVLKDPTRSLDSHQQTCEFCSLECFTWPGFTSFTSTQDYGYDLYITRLERCVSRRYECDFCGRIADVLEQRMLAGQTNGVALEANDLMLYIHVPVVADVPGLELWKQPKAPRLRHLTCQVAHNIPRPERDPERTGIIVNFQRLASPDYSVSSFCEGKTPSRTDRLAFGGRLRPSEADFRLFRHWLHICQSSHGDWCKSAWTTPMKHTGLRLVDVTRRCIVYGYAPQTYRYAALSYVWGHSTDTIYLSTLNHNELQRAGALRSAFLPRTVEDAIAATAMLDLQYLWVDALCIIQDDSADKGHWIPQMGAIYGGAEVTLVAAFGDNSDAGLPGVAEASRSPPQIPVKMGNNLFIENLDPLGCGVGHLSYLGYSPWTRRAWCLQERLLSSRRLVFTGEQVYWECAERIWWEDAHWEEDSKCPLERKVMRKPDANISLDPANDDVHSVLNKIIREYTSRELTYPSDILKAIDGILTTYQFNGFESFWWGLPESTLSIALAWWMKDRPGRRTALANSRMINDPREEKLFPSWSWAGWHGSVSEVPYHTTHFPVVPALQIYKITRDRRLVQISGGDPAMHPQDIPKVQWQGRQKAIFPEDIPPWLMNSPKVVTALCFWASVVECEVCFQTAWRTYEPTAGLKQGYESGHILNGGRPYEVRWLEPPSDRSKRYRTLDLIILEQSTNRQNWSSKVGYHYFVLITSEIDGVWYREGICEMNHLDWVALEGRRWQPIVLC